MYQPFFIEKEKLSFSVIRRTRTLEESSCDLNIVGIIKRATPMLGLVLQPQPYMPSMVEIEFGSKEAFPYGREEEC